MAKAKKPARKAKSAPKNGGAFLSGRKPSKAYLAALEAVGSLGKTGGRKKG